MIKFFNDGRIIGRLGEFILEDKDVGKRSDNEGTSYDNVTDDNKHLEVRSITNRLSFAPSKKLVMVEQLLKRDLVRS